MPSPAHARAEATKRSENIFNINNMSMKDFKLPDMLGSSSVHGRNQGIGLRKTSEVIEEHSQLGGIFLKPRRSQVNHN